MYKFVMFCMYNHGKLFSRYMQLKHVQLYQILVYLLPTALRALQPERSQPATARCGGQGAEERGGGEWNGGGGMAQAFRQRRTAYQHSNSL